MIRRSEGDHGDRHKPGRVELGTPFVSRPERDRPVCLTSLFDIATFDGPNGVNAESEARSS
jgi:hypothetical protein